jgi:hypothetical protein
MRRLTGPPVLALKPETPRRREKLSLSVLRKLEVTSGSITVLLATLLSLFVLKFDWDASLTVGYEFAVLRELGLVLMIFILPGALVAIGAYAHGAKRNTWGRLVLWVAWR